MPKPKIVSLYTGAGGMDYGFEAAGYDTGVAVEIDPHSCETILANREWHVIERDIASVSTEELLEVAGCSSRDVDLVIGGPPCQPFSRAGYWAWQDSKRLSDPRAGTVREFMRVVRQSLPRVFVLENVPGMLFTGKDEGLRYVERATQYINQISGVRYRLSIGILNAADYGVPQARERVFVVGAREGRSFVFPQATHGVGDGLEPHRTAWDAIADVEPGDEEELSVTGKWAGLLASIPEGNNYLHHTSRGEGLPLFGWRTRYWSFLLKLAKDRPAWTIPAQPGPATGPFHWDNRHLSVKELCRLQTFPDDVVIQGDRRSIQRQVGNAVPSLLTEILGRSIRTQLLDLPATKDPLKLLPKRRESRPAATKTRKVPTPYRLLVGDHKPHPGTGRGARATALQELATG